MVMRGARRRAWRGRRRSFTWNRQPAAAGPAPPSQPLSRLAVGRIGYTQSLGLPSLRRASRAPIRAATARHRPVWWCLPTGSSSAVSWPFCRCSSLHRVPAIDSPVLSPYRKSCGARMRGGADRVTAATFRAAPASAPAAHRERPRQVGCWCRARPPDRTMIDADALTCPDPGRAGLRDRPSFPTRSIPGLDYAFPAATALKVSANAVVITRLEYSADRLADRLIVVPGNADPPDRAVATEPRPLGADAVQFAAEAAFDGATRWGRQHATGPNRCVLGEGLPEAGSPFLARHGAFYATPRARFCTTATISPSGMLEEAGVAATPGPTFDPVPGRASSASACWVRRKRRSRR